MIYTITRVGQFEKTVYTEPHDERKAKLKKRMVFESSCVGYYNTLEDAKNAVEMNWGGLDDCKWSYLVIESIAPGSFSYLADSDDYQRYWYNYTEKGIWVSCDAPDEFKNSVGFFT